MLDYGIHNNANEKPSFLYPFILKLLIDFVGIWGLDEYSKLWNFLVITLSSFLAFESLFLIYETARELFGKRVAIIASWI